jgi:F-type H+-transporting ATPase subunit b
VNLLARLPLLLAEGEHQSHHWWWPETKEIIWGTVAFAVVLYLLISKGGPPIKKMLSDRTARIQKQLDDSAAAKTDAEAEVAVIKANLRDLGADKAKVLADATVAADRVRTEGFARNDAEVTELEARADADIETARGRVQSEVSTQVAVLSGEAAERIVQQQLDDGARRDLVEQYIQKVGSAS